MDAGLRVQQGGSGDPVLLLLHGLGATGDVWDGWRPLLAQRWPGRWLAPDLPGHGGSPPLPDYTFDTVAAAVAGIASGGSRTVVLGHSLGGVVGLILASSGFAVPVHAVIGLGIKVAWTRQELDRAQAAAHRPTAWFASREEAAARYLRISGLAGLVAADAPAVNAGLRSRSRAWATTRTSRARACRLPCWTLTDDTRICRCAALGLRPHPRRREVRAGCPRHVGDIRAVTAPAVITARNVRPATAPARTPTSRSGS